MLEKRNSHYLYINNVMGNFIKGIADFFRTDWFPRCQRENIIISTYEKAVQHFEDRKAKGGENLSPKYPYIVFNPDLNFEPEPTAGKFFHGYPNFVNKYASKLYNPRIYQDDEVYIAPILNRYRGSFEMIMWCSSPYELIDYEAFIYQYFGGIDRIIYPKHIEGFIILPDEYLQYTYENPYIGVPRQLDWENSETEAILIKNINQNKQVFDFEITPWLKLTSVNDGSDKYGSAGDEIGDHRLIVNIEWECSLPTHLVLIAHKFPQMCHTIQMDITAGFHYIKVPRYVEGINDENINTDYFKISKEVISSYVDTTGAMHTAELIYDKMFQYIITEEDSAKLHKEDGSIADNIEITIPDHVVDCVQLQVYGKFGLLRRDFQWRLKSTNVIELVGFNLSKLEEGDVLSIVLYEIEDM